MRLRVANRPGRDTADDVVVVATALQRLNGSGGESTPIGLPLTWSGTNPPLTVASVHPGSERHVDLLHCDAGAAAAQLALTPKPEGGQDLLHAGAYEVSVEIRARNADASRYVVPVTWDGTWAEQAAIWEHLRVEPPRVIR